MNDDCVICTETMNIKTNKQITCEHCSFVICLSCFKTYMQETFPKVKCMNCSRELSISFVRKNVSKTFFNNEFIKAKTQHVIKEQNVYFHRKRIQNKKKYIDYKISKLKKEFNQKQNELVQQQKDIKLYRKQFPESITIDEAIIKHREVYAEYCKYHEVYLENLYELNKQSPKYNCFDNNCFGVLFGGNNELHCETCHNYVCDKCFIMKNDENHICSQEDLDTASYLKENSIPCPKCLSFISKTDGCNDMWCVNCNTAFMWPTGELIVGNFHNPHHSEMMEMKSSEQKFREKYFGPNIFNIPSILDNDHKGPVDENTSRRRQISILTNVSRFRDFLIFDENKVQIGARATFAKYYYSNLPEKKLFEQMKKYQKQNCYYVEMAELYNKMITDIEQEKDTTRNIYLNTKREIKNISFFYSKSKISL